MRMKLTTVNILVMRHGAYEHGISDYNIVQNNSYTLLKL